MIAVRPSVAPLLVAELTGSLPARLLRRLDERRDVAEGWAWRPDGDGWVVDAGTAVVRIVPEGGEVRAEGQLVCDCLIAPRCLHVAAVAVALPLGAGEAPAAAGPAVVAEADVVPVDDRGREAAGLAWRAAAMLLDVGATSAGLVAQGELLRAAHACRLAGLHRTAAALTRAVQRLGELHGQRPEYRLDALVGDVSDVLTSARAVARSGESAPRSVVGSARRAYAPVGSLRLAGVLTEAVVSAAGFAGVVTHLVDQAAASWTLADVAPGGVERVHLAYGAPVEVGDLALSHRELGRSAVYVQRATGSSDGRLGTGRAAGAVRSGPVPWEAEPLAALWRRPVPEQLDATFAALPLDRTVRRPGWDLLFVEGEVVGVRQAALVLATAAGEVSCYAPSDHGDLPYRRNLRLLGSAPGLRLRAAGRVLMDRSRALALLAVGPMAAAGSGDGRARLALPPEWWGRANLGVDALQSAHVPGSERAPVELEPLPPDPAAPDPLAPLARRLGQALTGGRVTQAEAAWSDIDRDVALLRRRQLPGAAARLEALRAASVRGLPDGRQRFALAWTAARAYQVAARSRLARTGWD